MTRTEIQHLFFSSKYEVWRDVQGRENEERLGLKGVWPVAVVWCVIECEDEGRNPAFAVKRVEIQRLL